MRVGITGDTGFIGQHLKLRLINQYKDVEITPFSRSYFDDQSKLNEFVANCDVVVHLASVIRHPDERYLYEENMRLTDVMVKALKSSPIPVRLIFLSSIKEGDGSAYGSAKQDSVKRFQEWCAHSALGFTSGTKAMVQLFEQGDARTNHGFTCIKAPNVFGPMATPHHNSVFATFSHEILCGIEPKIIHDNLMTLVFIDDLVDYLIAKLKNTSATEELDENKFNQITVAELKRKLQSFHKKFIEDGIVPGWSSLFDQRLFLSFISYIDPETYQPKIIDAISDESGSFSELIRSESSGQVSYSVIKPGATRGNHYHTRKFERFVVLQGQAEIKIRKVQESNPSVIYIQNSYPAYIDIPPYCAHSILNPGTTDLYMMYWINEFYDLNDPDTYPMKP